MMRGKRLNKIWVIVFLFVSAWTFAAGKTAADFFKQGLAAEENDDWYAASQYFMEALHINPVYSDAYYHLAECSFQLGEFEFCLSHLDEAEKYEKDSDRVRNLRGAALISLDKYAQARKIFESVLKNSPNNIEARFGLAELDLFDGRVTGAENQYMEALKRQSTNRKALLSMSLVSAGLGKHDTALKYLKQVLNNYPGDSEVHYIAALIYSMQNDLAAAEKQCRIAVEINGNYDKAYEQLAKIRYAAGAYADVEALCDFRINRNRNLSSAYYLKGAAQSAAGNTAQAINTWTDGLKINPEDEVMRASLELAVNSTVSIEDSRRPKWASYHIKSAQEYMRRFDSQGALYEYQRALKINPTNEEARLAFAKRLSMQGMHELYLDQLLFLKENENLLHTDNPEGTAERKKTAAQIKRDDIIEAYSVLLQDTLAKKWDVEPFYLDKIRWKIGIYHQDTPVNQLHIENNKIAAEFASDIFSGIALTSVKTFPLPVEGFGNAYQKARSSGMDYFIMISVDEGARDFVLNYTMYSARTGSELASSSLYGTANHRYANVFRRFRADILEKLPVRAKVIGRSGKTLLLDIGKSENLAKGSVFNIVKKNGIQTSAKEIGLTYRDNDVLGTLTITETGEEVSEGLLEYKGFYDRVNTADEAVLISVPEKDDAQTSPVNDRAPAAIADGTPAENLKIGLTAQDLGIRRAPSFIDIIRSIY